MLKLFISLALGLFIGSFLNCVVYRLEHKKSFLRGRSFCPKCKHTLKCLDLIPLFSFLILGGKCRYCKKKISLQYFLVELSTGFVFLIIALKFTALFDILCFFALWAILIAIFIFDLKHYIIPDKLVWLFFALVFLFRGAEVVFNQIQKRDIGIWAVNLKWHWLFAFLALSFFFLIWFLSRGKAMGLGDVKLIFPLTLMLGWPFALVGLFISFLGGSLVGIALIIAGKKKLKSKVPFGPFLIAGSFTALFFGGIIWKWYLKLLI